MDVKVNVLSHGTIQHIEMFKPSKYDTVPCPRVIYNLRDSTISIWHGRHEKAVIRKGNVLFFDESFKKGWTLLVTNYDGSQVYYDADDRQLKLENGLQFFESCLNIIDFSLNTTIDNMIIDRIIQLGGKYVEENIQKYKVFRYEDHELYKNAFFNKLTESESPQV
jgi:hypothetical protein